MLVKDIELKEVNVGDDIIFSDNLGINKGKVVRITDKTIKLNVYEIHEVSNALTNTFHTLRLYGCNGKYIYKV